FPLLRWATVRAVSLWPLYLKFATRFMDGPSAAAAIVFTVLVALIVATPISLAVYTVAEQSDMLLDWLKRARGGDRGARLGRPPAYRGRKHAAMVARQSVGSESGHRLAEDAQCGERV